MDIPQGWGDKVAVVLQGGTSTAAACGNAAMLGLALVTELRLLFPSKNVILMEKGSLPDHFLPPSQELCGDKMSVHTSGAKQKLALYSDHLPAKCLGLKKNNYSFLTTSFSALETISSFIPKTFPTLPLLIALFLPQYVHSHPHRLPQDLVPKLSLPECWQS